MMRSKYVDPDPTKKATTTKKAATSTLAGKGQVLATFRSKGLNRHDVAKLKHDAAKLKHVGRRNGAQITDPIDSWEESATLAPPPCLDVCSAADPAAPPSSGDEASIETLAFSGDATLSTKSSLDLLDCSVMTTLRDVMMATQDDEHHDGNVTHDGNLMGDGNARQSVDASADEDADAFSDAETMVLVYPDSESVVDSISLLASRLPDTGKMKAWLDELDDLDPHLADLDRLIAEQAETTANGGG